MAPGQMGHPEGNHRAEKHGAELVSLAKCQYHTFSLQGRVSEQKSTGDALVVIHLPLGQDGANPYIRVIEIQLVKRVWQDDNRCVFATLFQPLEGSLSLWAPGELGPG